MFSKRSWKADGGVFVEWRRRGSGELVARSEGGRMLIAVDATKEERDALKGE